MKTSQLVNIFLVIFIILVGFGLIMPLMPFYVAEYGGSAFVVGLLVASYAAAQFVGSPLMGRLSDRHGRRPLLAVGMGVTALGFLLLALAEPLGRGLAGLLTGGAASASFQNSVILGVMFLSRIITGMAGGIISVANAYIADITDESNRTQGMGVIGAAFGLGFIVGPVIGGVLSQWGYDVPAYAAAGLAALNVATILLLLPESLSDERKAELAARHRRPLIDLPDMAAKVRRPRLGPLLIIRLFASLGAALFMSMFTLWAMTRLGLNARVTSNLLAYFGFLTIVAQVGLIGPLTRRYAPPRLITVSLAVMGAATLAWALTPSVPILMAVMVPLALASGVINTVINSAVSWAVSPAEMGDALGTSSAFESLARVFAPPLGGWLLGTVGPWAPGALAAALLTGLTIFAWQRLLLRPDPEEAITNYELRMTNYE